MPRLEILRLEPAAEPLFEAGDTETAAERLHTGLHPHGGPHHVDFPARGRRRVVCQGGSPIGNLIGRALVTHSLAPGPHLRLGEQAGGGVEAAVDTQPVAGHAVEAGEWVRQGAPLC